MFMQGYAKKINQNKNNAYQNNYVDKDESLKDHIGRVGDVSR